MRLKNENVYIYTRLKSENASIYTYILKTKNTHIFSMYSLI